MNSIRLDVETLTATFLHVEPDGEARWRAAPFRGLARWWFRALVGASIPPDEVRRREAEMFGTAEEPSAVTFRVFPNTSSRMEPRKFDVNPGSQRNAMKSAIPPGSKATIEIAPMNDTSDAAVAVRQAYAALWAALHLGGIGQRSRRGAGSLRITDVHGVVSPKHVQVSRPSDPADYAQGLGQAIRDIRALIGVSGFRPLGHEAEFPVMHPNCASAWVVGLSWPRDNGTNGNAEARVRLAIMAARRNLDTHKTRRPEREFGSITTRLSSPTWVRAASITENSALLVVTLLRHSGAGNSTNWGNVEAFVRAMDPKAAKVDLGG